jgi:hypothetical protein
VREFKKEILRKYTLREILQRGAANAPHYANFVERVDLCFKEQTVHGACVSGYIECHTDRPVRGERKWFFHVFYQAPGCVFIYTDENGKFAMIRRFDPKVVYSVQFKKIHALVPTAIGEKMVELNSCNFPEYNWFEAKAKTEYSRNPKLVFAFLNALN